MPSPLTEIKTIMSKDKILIVDGRWPRTPTGGMKTLSKTDTKKGLDNRGHYTEGCVFKSRRAQIDFFKQILYNFTDQY